MKLHELKSEFKIKKKKRVGRGISAGGGKTAGRGTKGQKSRSGGKLPPCFEGGQMSLIMRLPKKRGFKNPFKKVWQVVNIESLNKFKAGEKITPEVLEKENLIDSSKGLIKILSKGSLDKKLDVTADKFSQKAQEKIEKSGGKAILRGEK